MIRIFLIFSLLFSVLIGVNSCGSESTNNVVKATPESIDSLLNLYPDSVELLLFRGNLAFNDYNFSNALMDAAKAFRLDSSNIEARMLYAQIQNNKPTKTVADVAIAQRHFSYIVSKQPKNTKALVALASTYAYQQDFDKAFVYVDRALKIDKKYRDAYVLKGSMFLLMERVDLAKSSYETAVQQDPKFYEAYLRLGSIYQAEDDSICFEYFTTAYKLQPKNAEVIYALAYANQEFNRFKTAKNYYRKMIQNDTTDYYVSRGLFHLAYIQQFNDKNLDSAIYYYSSAIETNDAYVEAYHNRGMCYEDKGDIPNAMLNFSTALKINPSFELSRIAAEKHKALNE